MSPADRLYPYRLLLDLPTAHLTVPTRAWLEVQALQTAANGSHGGSILDVGFLPFGFYLRVQTDHGEAIPADLQACLRKAADLGAFAILFDAHAEPNDLTGDLPVYDESADDAVVPREPGDDPEVGTVDVFVLSCAEPNENPHQPGWPTVFGSEAAAEAGFKEALREEWVRMPPCHADTANPLPFPDAASADQIHQAMTLFHGEAWGQFILTRHCVVPVPRPVMPPDRPFMIGPLSSVGSDPYRKWSLMSDLDSKTVDRLVGMAPRGAFGRADTRAAMAARGWTDLADLARAMPDEVLALPNINLASLFALQRDIRSRVSDAPLVTALTPAEIDHLEGVPLHGAGLVQGSGRRLSAIGVITLADLARTSEAKLDAAGLSKVQIDGCETCILEHLDRPEWPRQRRRKRAMQLIPYDPGYDQRPLPPGLAEIPIRQTRLGLSWLSRSAEASGYRTLGDLIATLPDRHHEPSRVWEPEPQRGLQYQIARVARAIIADIPDGDQRYRVPFLWQPAAEPDPLFWGLTDDGIAYLDTIRPDRRALGWDDLPPSRQRILYDHGLDTLGLVADADLAFLFEILHDKAAVCQTIQDIRGELIAYDATLSPDD
jgi:hypothetical protein